MSGRAKQGRAGRGRASGSTQRRGAATSGAQPGRYPLDTATAELFKDLDNPGGWYLYLDQVPHAYLDLDDPTRLEFEYVRWIGDVLESLAPPGARLDTAHLGGGGFTLPRYVAATRPHSEQVVFEYDGKLVELMRASFDIRTRKRMRVRVTDARRGLSRLEAGSYDVVIRDAFAGRDVPPHLCTIECAAEVSRVLRPTGTYVLNAADRPGLPLVRAELATLRATFEQVAMVIEPAVLRGRRYGNAVMVASHTELPIVAMSRAVARGAAPGRLVHGDRLTDLVGTTAVRTDPDSPSDQAPKPPTTREALEGFE